MNKAPFLVYSKDCKNHKYEPRKCKGSISPYYDCLLESAVWGIKDGLLYVKGNMLDYIYGSSDYYNGWNTPDNKDDFDEKDLIEVEETNWSWKKFKFIKKKHIVLKKGWIVKKKRIPIEIRTSIFTLEQGDDWNV